MLRYPLLFFRSTGIPKGDELIINGGDGHKKIDLPVAEPFEYGPGIEFWKKLTTGAAP
jgi:hypothetical protein